MSTYNPEKKAFKGRSYKKGGQRVRDLKDKAATAREPKEQPASVTLLAKDFTALLDEVTQWRRLYLDKPEDRLWHDSDQTWWTRKDDTHYGIGGLFRAEPPGPVKKLMEENAKLKARITRLLKKGRAS